MAVQYRLAARQSLHCLHTPFAAQSEVERVRNALAAAENELAVMSQRDVRVASIPAFKDDFRQGAISLFYAPDATTALITAHNLPPLSPRFVSLRQRFFTEEFR